MLDINPDLALKNANIVSHALPDRSVAQLVTKKMQTWQVAHLADLSHNCLSDEPGPANPAGETKSERGPMGCCCRWVQASQSSSAKIRFVCGG